MITKFEFTWRTDSEYGTDGWIPKNKPDFNAGDARLVAHDCIEHAYNDDGSIEAELMAIGGALYGRYNALGDVTEQGLASDLLTMLSDSFHYAAEIRPCRANKIEDEHAIEYMRAYAIKSIDYEIGEKTPLEYKSRQVRNACAWVRKGYRRAAKKYGTSHAMVSAFEDVRLAVEDIQHPDIGDTLIVYAGRWPRVVYRSVYDNLYD